MIPSRNDTKFTNENNPANFVSKRVFRSLLQRSNIFPCRARVSG